MFGRNRTRRDSSAEEEEKEEERRSASGSNTPHDSTAVNGPTEKPTEPDYSNPSKAQIKRATRTRLICALLSSLFLLISVAFVILVEVGSVRVDSILNDIYFIRLDLSDIIPISVPNSVLINSIAQSLGLHDYYTVGLWGFCYGDNGTGFLQCSKPRTLYWFDPVSILRDELLAGASIALPTELTDILELIRIVSHFMFALFLTGACLSFVMIFIVPLAVYSRWASFPIMIFTFLTALFTTVAAVLATALFIIMAHAITVQTELNIGANVGVEMFTFMWIAAAFAILAWLVQLSLCCCCASRRDVGTGRKHGSRKAWR